jgi:hypothetical protein
VASSGSPMQVVLLCRTLNGLGCYGRAAMPAARWRHPFVARGPRPAGPPRAYIDYIYIRYIYIYIIDGLCAHQSVLAPSQTFSEDRREMGLCCAPGRLEDPQQATVGPHTT